MNLEKLKTEQLPWPESMWPMTDKEYSKAVSDPNLRTAISGFLMREGWLLALKYVENEIADRADEIEYNHEEEQSYSALAQKNGENYSRGVRRLVPKQQRRTKPYGQSEAYE